MRVFFTFKANIRLIPAALLFVRTTTTFESCYSADYASHWLSSTFETARSRVINICSRGDGEGMSLDEQEYIVAPWGTDSCETEDITVELPARGVVAQLEVPRHVLERMVRLGEQHDISPERALAQRLELNRARMKVMAAQVVGETTRVQRHLGEARELLDSIDTLDTAEIDTEIERIWSNELGLP